MKKLKSILRSILPKKIKYLLQAFGIYCSKKVKAVTHNCFGFLILTPQHSNFGDHAITLSEMLLFKRQNYYVIEITGKELVVLLNCPTMLKNLIKDKPIFINGGGNLGTLWFDGAELPIRQIITLFPNNLKVIFPNTVFYDDSEFGRKELKNSEEIYNKDQHLVIMAREKLSYEFLRKHYNNNRIYLIPDMVLYLNPSVKNIARKGAMVLFRSDCEKTLSENDRKKIILFLKTRYKQIEISDMTASNDIRPQQRESELNKKFLQFCSKEIVVTDRLHGMIFSAVTGTPCVVLNSKSPKVKGVYDWMFKDCPYILFAEKDDFHSIEQFMDYIHIAGQNFVYNCEKLKFYYEKLIQIINGANVNE